MSSQSTSSRSSMSSASARLYSPQLLLQLAASRGAQSSTAASANLLQLDAQRFFADILVESDDSSSSSSRASSRLSAHSLLSEDHGDSEDEDDEWVYGEGELRTDLSTEIIEQLRNSVYLALDEPSYPAVTSSSPSSNSSKPAAVLVSTNTANPNRLPLVYDNSFGGRINQRRANPGGVFGRPTRKTASSGCGADVQNPNSSNADRESWRSSVLASRTRRIEAPGLGPRVSKEADSKSWRRLEPGAQWAWNDNAGYVVIKT